MPCHYGKNCLLFLFFCIYTDNRIFAFFVLVYQLVNFLKLLISIFTCFHCDSFLHFLSSKPCFFKSCFTTCGVIFIPLELKASEIFSRLRFVHFISAFMGLPAVW